MTIEPVADLVALDADEQRARAQHMAATDPTLTGAALAARFGRSPRWGRKQIEAARHDTTDGTVADGRNGNGTPAGTGGPRATTPWTASGTPDGTDGTTPDVPAPATKGKRRWWRHDRPPLDAAGRAARAERLTVRGTTVAMALVILAPIAESFHSLAGWGQDRLGLEPPLTYVVPVTLDAAALACVGLTFHAMLRADSAGIARLLVWVFAGASSWANWRHGQTISADAAVYYAAQPLIAAVLLDICLRRVRRTALAGIGGIERPLPRYRAARWMVAPAETWGAWRTAVRENITDPSEALALYRRNRSGVPVADDDADELDLAELPEDRFPTEPAAGAEQEALTTA